MNRLLLLPLLLLSVPAHAETWDLHIIEFWDSSPVDPDTLLWNVEELNALWAPMGISFRPTIDSFHDPVLAGIQKDSDPALKEQALAYADGHPDHPHLFIVPHTSICWGRYPQTVPDDKPQYANDIFCNRYKHIGKAYAHELGHALCLGHTFTNQDEATHNPVSHDGDGIADTPDDPGRFETGSGAVGGDESDTGPGHSWCTTTTAYDSVGDGVVVDELIPGVGAAHTYACTVNCFQTDVSDGTQSGTWHFPLVENGMGYYESCKGPWALDGVRHEFFTPGQVARVEKCIDDYPFRSAYVDVCAGDSDTDHDGLCDANDPCPDRPSLRGLDTDSDSDGVVDGCDVCPGFPGNGTDTDGDGFCDDIDIDDDNDGCQDYQDKHPLERMLAVGYRIAVGGSCESQTLYAFEGGSAFPGGGQMCHKSDHDIDNDGILDDDDACPTQPGVTACVKFEACPLMSGDWRLECLLGDCNELELHKVSRSNPDPTIYRHVEIVNDSLYVFPNAGESALTTAASFAPSRGERVRLELVSTRGGQHTLVTEYDGGSYAGHPPVRGAAVALTPGAGGRGLGVDVTWGVGVSSEQRLADSDADETPDNVDNCIATANISQHDDDHDGYGNACDGDLDNDGRVGVSDLLLLLPALGTDGTVEFAAPPDGAEEWADALAGAEELWRADADLDGDNVVGARDLRLFLALMGSAPGPSAFVR